MEETHSTSSGQAKTCQNCKSQFIIEDEDAVFYEKIQVPPPTFCPQCRTIRRLCWRNEMSLFRRPCNAPDHTENLISFYPPEEKLTVYDLKYWWSDVWDATQFGKDYDFSKPFFQQWSELYRTVPLQCLSNSKATNSDYCNVAEESRDSYMCSGSWRIERTLYSNRIADIKDSSDLYVVNRSELCYFDVSCADSYRLLYSVNCKNCVDSYFLYDCHGCTNCFGCSNLRSKSYCMYNEQLSKEEYQRRLAEMDLAKHSTIEALKEKFKTICLGAIHRFSNQVKAYNCTGDNIENAKNCKVCFDVTLNIEDSKYVHWAGFNGKQMYDSGPGVGDGSLMYEVFDTGIGNFRNLFTSVVYSSSEVEYSFNCYSCTNLFGCIGLRSKNYCIFNQQYSKEEYETLIPKIKEHMMAMPYVDARGKEYRYGEFFPAELSPFAYNETVAQDYFPLTKDVALEKGYKWREKKNNEYAITIKAQDLPDSLEDAPATITDAIISCANSGTTDRCLRVFKITPDEFALYKRLQVPLPRVCFACRHAELLQKRNPMQLWHRTCMKEGCKNEFETTYSPQRPEKVYCESCYQSEVL